MDKICSYYTLSENYVVVLWDSQNEEVLLLNYGMKNIKRLTDLKNMKYHMLYYIANNILSFDYINGSMLYLNSNDISDLKECSCYDNFIKTVQNYIDIINY